MRHFLTLILMLLSNLAIAYDMSKKIDFDISMGIANKPTYDFMFRHSKSAEYYHTFRKLYNSNYHRQSAQEPRIPKIIHQIWLGGELPRFFNNYIETCKQVNPGWEYKFWTEKDLDKLSYNKDVVYALKGRLDVTKDYLMHVILDQFGGVFMDVDYACFKPFEQLNYQYDAWFAIEPSGWWKKIPTISYSIIAAKANYPVIQKTLKDIEQYSLDKDFRIRHNKEYTHRSVKADIIFSSVQMFEGININEYCKHNSCDNVMIFPATYFLPRVHVGWMVDNMKKFSLLDTLKMHFGLAEHAVIYDEIKPETIAMNDFNAKAKINPLYYKEKSSNY
ncbi:MAG: hypothetical protein KBC27_00160 [Rickettsiales bacterium]|nr:hypothetical protein [Rickettsiales bacterium]